MPPSGTRRSRGRGRGPWKRDSRLAPSRSKTDTEAESQQQDSNRTSPSHETKAKPEDRKGHRRKGRPPSKTRRGRVVKQEIKPLDADLMDCDESNREAFDKHSFGNVAANESSHQGILAMGVGSALLRDDYVRSARSKAQSGEGAMDVESEAENAVSETEESQVVADPRLLEASNRLGLSPFDRVKDARTLAFTDYSNMKASDFPFVVFQDERGILRAKSATFVVPICVGSIAFWLGKKAPEKKCYRWVVYVRSPANVDLSHVIDRVKFRLHSSFSQPDRYVDSPPYELEETGWGEFDIGISIEFHEDAAGPPVEITHSLKLYTTTEPSTRKPVVSEKYDEIIFSEPPAAFFQRVKNEEDRTAPLSRCDSFFPRYEPHVVDDCLHRINLVRSRMRNEVRALLEKAEARGMQIDLPEASRLIEQSTAKNTHVAATSNKGSVVEATLRPEVRTKTRIIIDGDNKDEPLRIEVEQSKQKGLYKGPRDNQSVYQTPDRIVYDLASRTPPAEMFVPEDVVMMDVDTPVSGVADANASASMRAVGVPFGVEECGSKSSDKIEEPQTYDEISSSGECPEQHEQPPQPVASHPSSKTPIHGADDQDKDSRKGSGSSCGGASGTHPTAFEGPEDDLL